MKKLFLVVLVSLPSFLCACVPQNFLSCFSCWGSESSSKQEVKVYPLKIDQVYLSYIISGEKTSEGRLNLPDYSGMVPGDFILFYDDYDNSAVCSVGRITCYPTFERMLTSEGVYNMLPQISPETNNAAEMVAKGVYIYDSFPGYQEGVKVYGAIAFTLRYDGDQLPESYASLDVEGK